jgi:hypothetical protein
MLKDQKLDEFAQRGVNIAQFVSYGPDGKKRYSRIRGTYPEGRFDSVEQALQAILHTGAPYVNIRSFTPTTPDGNPFFMGRRAQWASLTDAADVVRSLIRRGLYVIVNEDIDINDGGFSGVVMGEIAEFAPQDTPRCVDRKGEPRCAVMNRGLMEKLVLAVYGRRIGFPYSRNHRIEFSVHPGPVGYLRGPLLMWQEEAIERGTGPSGVTPRWPNRYSIAMGDKAYGLLMAHLHGLSVPFTRVTGRLIPPFEFGEHTNDGNTRWMRTAPRTQQPGKFTTMASWTDPFALIQREDPDGSGIAAILEQDNVSTERGGWSGAAITQADGTLLVEGRHGRGDGFMVGSESPTDLPVAVIDAVTRVWEQARIDFGPIRFEWVYDRDHTVWVVQLHAGASDSVGDIIYPGEPTQSWQRYDVVGGLEGLRQLVGRISTSRFPGNTGIVLVGNVGITSHFGDLLRRAKIPSRLERPSV